MRKNYFTLTELGLVVVSLMILGGLSFSIFKHARTQAIEGVCANNMRIIQSGVIAYQSDWGELPLLGFKPTHTTPLEEREDEKATALLLHEFLGSNNAYLPKYAGMNDKEQFYFCPAAHPNRESANSSDYGVNCGIFRRINKGNLEKYPTAIMFADGYGDYHLMRNYDWIGFRWRHGDAAKTSFGYAPSIEGNCEILGRYGDGYIQAIMVDGSVKKFNYADRETVYNDYIAVVPDDRTTY